MLRSSQDVAVPGVQHHGADRQLEHQVTAGADDKLRLSARNLHKVEVMDAAAVDPVSLIRFEKVLMTADAVKKFEEQLA